MSQPERKRASADLQNKSPTQGSSDERLMMAKAQRCIWEKNDQTGNVSNLESVTLPPSPPLALHLLIPRCERNSFIPSSSLRRPPPGALLCVINYDCAGWQHTATVLINYQQEEEPLLSSPSSPPPFFSSLSTFFFPTSLSFCSCRMEARGS